MIKVGRIYGTKAQVATLNSVLDYLNNIWSDDDFKTRVLTASFTETTDSSAQVWIKMHSGDIIIPSISFYTPSWWQRLRATVTGLAVVASESADGSITINGNIFATSTLADKVANIGHESMHVLGYKHDFMPTAARPASVPYQIQAILLQIVN